jgi:hypothetical protein
LNPALVVIAHFTELSEAQIACGFLQANGLGAVLHNTNLAALGLPVAQGTGGISLMVPEAESGTARGLLRDVASGAFAVRDEPYDQD